MTVLDAITQLLKDNNLSLNDIKCFSIHFWDGEDANLKTISLPTYKDNKPAMYDEYREVIFKDIAEYSDIEGFGTIWLNNGDWLFRDQPQLEEVYPDGWRYATVPEIPKSLILNSQGNLTPEQV